MKFGFAAVSALTLMSVGAANAAVTTYNFDNATVGDQTLAGSAPFSTGLMALGVTSVSATAGSVANPTPGVSAGGGVGGTQSFFSGWGGSWTLVFGAGGGPSSNINGVNAFQFVAFESESTVGGVTGFRVDLFNTSGVQIGSPLFYGQTPNLATGQTITYDSSFLGGAQLGRVVFTDLGDASHVGGDGIQIDNLQVDTNVVGTPEPSTYLMIGSALAGMAMFRRRRA